MYKRIVCGDVLTPKLTVDTTLARRSDRISYHFTLSYVFDLSLYFQSEGGGGGLTVVAPLSLFPKDPHFFHEFNFYTKYMLKLVQKRYIFVVYFAYKFYFLNLTDNLESAALIHDILITLVVWSMV